MTSPDGPVPLPADDVSFAGQRTRMVERDLRDRGIRDERVLSAMLRVPRHMFVPPDLSMHAYDDMPLPTRCGQTISQPYIVALMTEALGVEAGARILEVGTGTGYQAAVLSAAGARVWSIEARDELYRDAAARLAKLGWSEIQLRCGDGTLGWPEAAPFDGILATGSLPRRPDRLLEQLRPGGVFVGPIGSSRWQHLVRIRVDPPRRHEETLCACAFVPLVGAAGWSAPGRDKE